MYYTIVDSIVTKITNRSWIKVQFASDEITVESEEYVYDIVSFIADCGGALGLFLGFSFYMLWDVFLFIEAVLSDIIKRS